MTIGIWQLIVIVLLVVVLFGSGKLRSFGSDLAESIKGFKKAMQDEDKIDVPPTAIDDKEAQDADFTSTGSTRKAADESPPDRPKS